MLFCAVLVTNQSAIAEPTNHQSNGWYLGGSLGRSDTLAETTNSFSQNESAGSYGLFGGKNITDWAGFEFFYIQTGDVSNNRQNVTKASFYAHGMTSKFTYRFNSQFSLYGKLGLARLVYEEEYSSGLVSEEDWSNVVGTYGLGALYEISRGVKMRLGYDRFEGTLDDGGFFFRQPDVKAKLGQTSLSLYYQF